MDVLLAVVLAVLAFFLILQIVWVQRFVSVLQSRTASTALADSELPRALVVLSLRGSDPFLPRCLEGLLTQDYPNFDVRIVIDSDRDPAWSVVHGVVERFPDASVQVKLLERRRSTCSLKLSALLQETSDLDECYDAVALIDADAIPYKHWLRDLMVPLADPKVGVVSGIRWFMPTSRNWGTVVRYIWNAAGAVQMNVFKIAWGGSLAIKADVFRRSSLLERWANSFVEDVQVQHATREIGLQIRHAPVLMVNREKIGLINCCRFIKRQMVSIRLYHESWKTLVAYAIFSTLTILAAIGIGTVALFQAEWITGLLCIGGVAAYALGLTALLGWLEYTARTVMRARGESTARLPLRVFSAALLTLLLYLACVLSAMATRRISWRGITYELNGPWKIRLLEYQPYCPPARTVDASVL